MRITPRVSTAHRDMNSASRTDPHDRVANPSPPPRPRRSVSRTHAVTRMPRRAACQREHHVPGPGTTGQPNERHKTDHHPRGHVGDTASAVSRAQATASCGADRVRPGFPSPAATAGAMCLGLLLTLGVPVHAEDQPSLDEMLGLPDDKPQQDEPQGENGGANEGPDRQELEDALDPEQASHLFQQAIDKLDHVAQRLSNDRDPGVSTQREQAEVIRMLDQVIASAKKQQQKSNQSSSSGSQGQSSSQSGDQQKQGSQGQQPQQGSAQNAQSSESSSQTTASGQRSSSGTNPPGAADRAGAQSGPMQSDRTDWGNLPPRVREQLEQGLSERFSSIYERATERYYRRLAEEEE